MARSDQRQSTALRDSRRRGGAMFRGAFGITLGVVLALALVIGVLAVLFM